MPVAPGAHARGAAGTALALSPVGPHWHCAGDAEIRGCSPWGARGGVSAGWHLCNGCRDPSPDVTEMGKGGGAPDCG